MATQPSTARRGGAITPQAVGSRLTTVVSLVAAAIMFGVGFFAGAMLTKMVGAPDGATTIGGWVGGALFAGYSLTTSVRRMVRRRARSRT